MSLELNVIPKEEFVMIQYPGMVKNVNQMLETLGGITNISQVFDGDTKRLELRYHPKNPFNKGLFGDYNKGVGLLISVKIKRPKQNKNDDDNNNKPVKLVANVLGRVYKSITFESMCDYQYLPLVQDKSQGELNMILNNIVPKSVLDIDYFSRSQVPFIALPTQFARLDSVHPNIFRGDYSKEDGKHEILGVLQKTCYESHDVVNFNMVDSFPMSPNPQLIKRMKVKYVSDEQFQKVKKLFESCPIWTRIALLYESGLGIDKLKCITPALSYYVPNGPWRTLHIRYGYDPRKDFYARYYQTFDFRLRFLSGISDLVLDRKSINKRRHINLDDVNPSIQDINYPYLEEYKLPRSRQCIMRYCDIHIPKIQEMLEKTPSPLAGVSCNERTGWLPVGFDAQVRQIISNAMKELLKQQYRKEQLHDELESLENEVEIEEGEPVSDDEEEDETADDGLDDETIERILQDMENEGN